MTSMGKEAAMSLRFAGTVAPLLAVLGLMALPSERLAAQYSQSSSTRKYESGWESDRLRVRNVSVQPGARLAAPQGDAVRIYLTADLDGRMPPAEAIWQPAGGTEQENRGRFRTDAIEVDLKAGSAGGGSGTPLEAVPMRDDVEARTLIDNPRVLVMRLRYLPYALGIDRLHYHPQDALVVYLSGGYTWPIGGWSWGYPTRVRRGDFDVVPANTMHSFSNAGDDTLDFLVILPK
jgi:mannose-6-phosphate isomerase-like protein (cupin superfamily)